jgi:hypothetical protein
MLLAVTAITLCACNDDPCKQPPKSRLEGSLSQVMETGFDEVRAAVAATDISLTFVRIKPLGGTCGITDGGGTTEDYPLKVAYRLLDEPVGGRVDLASLDMNGAQRGVASRLVANDPRNVLPLILRGTMYFDKPLDPGTTVGGDFHITFENGIEAASGRTVFATTFQAKVQ